MIKSVVSFFFALASLTAGAQNLDWYLNVGGVGYDEIYASDVDEVGSVYVSGTVSSAVDLDPGSGIAVINAAGQNCLFVAKYAADGVLLWHQEWSDPTLADIHSRDLVTRNGEVWIAGNFLGDLNFDPDGASYFSSSIHGDGFILKLDEAGQFLDVTTSAVTAHGDFLDIEVDANGDVYSCGYVFYEIDLDPSDGPGGASTISFTNCYVSKFDVDLDVLWTKDLNATLGVYTIDVDVDQVGQVYCAGTYFGQGDFNAGNPDGIVGDSWSANQIGQNYVVKFLPNSDFVWVKTFGGDDTDFVTDVLVDGSGELYIIGTLNSGGDMDPGDGVYIVDSGDVAAVGEVFILHTNQDGNLDWITLYGDGISGMSPAVSSLSDDNLIIGGSVSSDHFVMVTDLSGVEIHTFTLPTNIYGVNRFQNKLYVNGIFQGSIDVDPNVGVVEISTPDNVSNGIFISYDLMSEDTLDVSLCYGDSIYLEGAWQDEAGYYTDSLTNLFGMDSIVHYHVVIPYYPTDPTFTYVCDGSIQNISTSFVGDSYLWSTGEEISAINIATSGLYTCTITGFGCSIEDSVYVTTLANPVVSFGYWANQDTTGVVAIIDGGEAPFDVLWDSPVVVEDDSMTYAGSGNYHCVVTDNHGCVGEHTETIDQLTSIAYVDVPLCYGDSVLVMDMWRYEEGYITDTLTNQYGLDSLIEYLVYTPYYPTVPGNFYTCGGVGEGLLASFIGDTYLWNTGEETSVATITGEGLYVCAVTGFGCTVLDSTYVHFWESPSANVEYWSDCNAFGVRAEITGGTPPYSLNWDYPFFATTDSIEYVGAGLYHATISDANGCLAEAISNIEDPIVSCTGDLDGNQVIGVYDLIILIGEYGNTDAFCDPQDLNDDGVVDINDVLEMIVLMGGICNP